MKNLLLLIIFCFSTFVSLHAIATPYTISDSSFIDNGWAKPLNKTLATDTDYDYDSSTYYSNFKYRHGAVDIKADVGDSVYAIDDGEIVKLYRDNNSSTYNLSVFYVKHKTSTGKEFLAIYGHSYAIAGLSVGNTVKKGQKIGTIKKYNSPVHIHFGIGLDVNCHPQRFGGIKCGITNPINFLKTYRNTSPRTLSYLLISGSNTINENQCKYYSVYAYYTNSSRPVDVTNKVYWGNSSWLTKGDYYGKVCASSVSRNSYTKLTADYNEGGIYKTANLSVTIKNGSTSIPSAVRYINQCIDKFSDYFGSKDGSAEVCSEDYYCQNTTGGTEGDVTRIAVHKSKRDVFWYLWGGWSSLELSYCD